tara:strand:+ start:974 stop:1168 length:195 start_codon:yes stop_codon:yes gene_type:complete
MNGAQIAGRAERAHQSVQLGLLKRFGSVHAAVAFFGVFIVSIAADKAIDKFRQCITIQSLQSKS